MSPHIFLLRCALWALLCCCAGAGFAQKPADLKRNGERFFAEGRWAESLAALEQYQAAKPGDVGVLTQIGIAHYHLHHPDKARKFLDYLLNQNPLSKDPDLHYYLARTLHGQQEWERAIAAYKGYLRAAGPKHAYRANAADNIRRCLSGMKAMPNEGVALVENLGDRVNTAGDEFGPVPSVNFADRLYFSAAREGSTGGRRDDRGLDNSNTGQWRSDMYLTRQSSAGWEQPKDANALLNTSRAEAIAGFDATGQVMYYFRGFTLYGGQIFADTAGRKDEYVINPPPLRSPMQPELGDRDPFFFNDSTLLFASRRPGGYGAFDLYVTRRRDTSWTAPQNLGPQINSAYDDITPFLARDGRTLYFSSNHTASMGGLDLYRASFEDKKREWSTPAHLGTPINSPDDDSHFRLGNDGMTAFFCSDRFDSRGERDIFQVYFKDVQTEQRASSSPPSFADVSPARDAGQEAQPLWLPALLYSSDRDVLSTDNLRSIAQAAAAAQRFPQATVLVTAYTDETGPAKFDLYYGIKRAEAVGKALAERGLPAERVMLRSVGAAYPIARNVIDAAPNAEGQRLNRRIEISLATPVEPLPVPVQVQRPAVSEVMANGAFAAFEQASAGLTYRVEMITTRQLLSNDAQGMFRDLMIESKPGSGAYQYSAGLLKQHSAAAQLRKDLQAQGFADAAVVAYLNGIRLSKAEAVPLVKKWPDLAAYVRG
ncbi:MAG TPA: OmpA family protein [Saprospiraceae bacterium]|nr:OmpA family protein [Saprospiraceae bacterium]HND89012.1 OmpA family protein [Saprospiraceae bacterium]